MKAVIIISNQGNHSGFNRRWDVLKFNTLGEAHRKLKELAFRCDDNFITRNGCPYNTNNREYVCTNKSISFEDDLIYHYIITKNELTWFSGGHYGYLPAEVEEFLK